MKLAAAGKLLLQCLLRLLVLEHLRHRLRLLAMNRLLHLRRQVEAEAAAPAVRAV